jgi:hypothetical protein
MQSEILLAYHRQLTLASEGPLERQVESLSLQDQLDDWKVMDSEHSQMPPKVCYLVELEAFCFPVPNWQDGHVRA